MGNHACLRGILFAGDMLATYCQGILGEVACLVGALQGRHRRQTYVTYLASTFFMYTYTAADAWLIPCVRLACLLQAWIAHQS